MFLSKGRHGHLSAVTLFDLYTEHIMRNARLDKLQAGIKIGGRNIKNLRYANGTTLMAESAGELNGLLMRVKGENGRASLKLNIEKTRSWHPPRQMQGGKCGNSDRFPLLGL